jgi:hypothetical protein
MERKLAMVHKPVLLKQASNKQELTNWENIIITKSKDCVINFEIPPADHLTKKFLNPVEGSNQKVCIKQDNYKHNYYNFNHHYYFIN